MHFFARSFAKIMSLTACGVAFQAATAGVHSLDGNPLDAKMHEKVSAAAEKLKRAPDDIAAIEVFLSVEPRLVETVGTNQHFAASDPLKNEALKWCQTLQPAEVLEVCLDKGSDAATHWALRQMVWRRHNGGFDEKSQARLMPCVERAVSKALPATRAQAVRTLLHFLPSEGKLPFLTGLLKDQPDEVSSAAVEGLTSWVHQSTPESEALARNWLKSSQDPLLLKTACGHWALMKRDDALLRRLKAEEIAPFERLAGHADEAVRIAVIGALDGEDNAAQPAAVAILLRMTHDPDPRVQWHAVRSLRDSNTPEVNARLHELFAPDQPVELRAAATEVLGVFGKENLLLLVKAAKTDPEPTVRQRAVYALRIIGTPEAGAALEVAAADADANVKREAREQLEWYRKEHPGKR